MACPCQGQPLSNSFCGLFFKRNRSTWISFDSSWIKLSTGVEMTTTGLIFSEIIELNRRPFFTRFLSVNATIPAELDHFSGIFLRKAVDNGPDKSRNESVGPLFGSFQRNLKVLDEILRNLRPERPIVAPIQRIKFELEFNGHAPNRISSLKR